MEVEDVDDRDDDARVNVDVDASNFYCNLARWQSYDYGTLPITKFLGRRAVEINDLAPAAFVRVDGVWTQNQYGLDGKRWQLRPLEEGEIEEFLRGDPATASKQDADWNHIMDTCAALEDPRLRALTSIFLSEFGDRFRRAAAARRNHHALSLIHI